MTNQAEWVTWNPVTGCSPVSEGCENCKAKSLPITVQKKTWDPSIWDQPKAWKTGRKIFVCTEGDLFHESVPFTAIANVFQVAADNQQHTFIITTKRPERMKQFFDEWWRLDVYDNFIRGGSEYKRPRLYLRKPGCSECCYSFLGCLRGRKKWHDKADMPNLREAGHLDYFGRTEQICDGFEWDIGSRNHGVAVAMDNGEISVRQDALAGPFPAPLKNVWLGVTVKSQKYYHRIKDLLDIPAAKRFVLFEPLLGPADDVELYLPGVYECSQCLSREMRPQLKCVECEFIGDDSYEVWGDGPTEICPECGIDEVPGPICRKCGELMVYEHPDTPVLDWVVVAGGARPISRNWVSKIRDDCRAARVPFYFKGWGEYVPWGNDDCDFMLNFSCDEMDRKFESTTLPGIDCYVYYRVGKKRTGRLLDGREHLEFPEVTK